MPRYIETHIAYSHNISLISMNIEISISHDIVKVELNMKLIKMLYSFISENISHLKSNFSICIYLNS